MTPALGNQKSRFLYKNQRLKHLKFIFNRKGTQKRKEKKNTRFIHVATLTSMITPQTSWKSNSFPFISPRHWHSFIHEISMEALPWTWAVLAGIGAHSGMRAPRMAQSGAGVGRPTCKQIFTVQGATCPNGGMYRAEWTLNEKHPSHGRSWRWRSRVLRMPRTYPREGVARRRDLVPKKGKSECKAQEGLSPSRKCASL